MPGKVERNRCRRRTVSEALSVRGSARLHLPTQVNRGNAAEVRHRDFVNRRGRELTEDLRMNRAAKKKERRPFRVSRRHNAVARLPQENAARHRDNPKAGRGDRKEEHHRQGHNSFAARCCFCFLLIRLAM